MEVNYREYQIFLRIFANIHKNVILHHIRDDFEFRQPNVFRCVLI